jgi:phospholipase/carboxylesterase
MQKALDGPRWGPASGGSVGSLVILLHGLGADGFDVIDLAPGWGRAVPDALFVAPHAWAPCDLAPYGRQWFSLPDRSPAMLRAGVDEAAAELAAWLDEERARLGLALDRVALMGFSQGAMTALCLGLGRARGCAAVLAYSGRLIAPDPPPAGAGPRILLVHGEEDEVVPASASRSAALAIAAAGVAVEAVFRPGLAHGIDEAGITLGALALQRALCSAT